MKRKIRYQKTLFPMTKKKNVLGRGLASILKNANTDITTSSDAKYKSVGNTATIRLENISLNPFQPRTEFNEENIEELSLSIEALGIIQPITVRKLGNNRYQLISGERRLRASKMAGKEDIPAFIRIANDEEMLEMALVENIQRKDLNPIEIALSYQRLINECKLTQKECSEKVGKKRSTITNFIRLLKLPEEIQSALKKERISMGHARALINIKNKDIQLNILEDTIIHGFSVREVEQIVKTFGNKKYKRTQKHNIKIQRTLTFESQRIIHKLSQELNTEIIIKQKKNGQGRIMIEFSSEKDLRRLIEKIHQKFE